MPTLNILYLFLNLREVSERGSTELRPYLDWVGLNARTGGITGPVRVDSRHVRLPPKVSGNLQCIDSEIRPPRLLVARLMQLPVMTPAERHREFVADFHPDAAGLSKAKMMRIGRLTSADKARLRGNKL